MLPYLIAKAHLAMGIENRIEHIQTAELYFTHFMGKKSLILRPS
jgi:hypothetical protein